MKPALAAGLGLLVGCVVLVVAFFVLRKRCVGDQVRGGLLGFNCQCPDASMVASAGGRCTCPSGLVLQDGKCVRCGVKGAPCCAGGVCLDKGIPCAANGRCVAGCGAQDQPCCADPSGGKCEATAPDGKPLQCQDQACKVCGVVGEPCCGQSCGWDGYPFLGCVGGSCAPCGQKPGAACCPSTSRAAGQCLAQSGATLQQCAGGTCAACGLPGQPCCSGSECQDTEAQSATCAGGACVACGGEGQPCCPESSIQNACRDDADACDPGTKTCVKCGGVGQPCCQGDCTDEGVHCMDGRCAACGGLGQPCCAHPLPGSGLRCEEVGSTCDGASCVACGGLQQPCCAQLTIQPACASAKSYCDESSKTCQAAPACGSGTTHDGAADCVPCGAAGQLCCGGTQPQCGTGSACDPTKWVCGACGQPGQLCCDGQCLGGAGSAVCDTGQLPPRCEVCGKSGAPCCEGGRCSDGSSCDDPPLGVPTCCGLKGGPCCVGGSALPCQGGVACTAGRCT